MSDDMTSPHRRTLLRRDERRSQLIRAATTAFARAGFAATSLDDVAQQAGVTKVLIYRHFASKAELYLGVLTDVRDRVRSAVGSADGYNSDTVRAFAQAACDDPDGFRLLFRHAAREDQFSAYADELFRDATRIAMGHLRGRVEPAARRRWLADLLPRITIEVTLSWLDADRPIEVDELSRTIRAALAALTHSHD
ncbi:TetR/AcrR family transcriptional regulator [Kutzneria kofuensis]|uniref:AcrR family transcriptional regulator n=1 Tax=Kutzneria kofuensis TaxID=103725 RepID=A0A7W9KCA5_9PSEU|nr:TetR/AcrR family transcriptional regulator [Kutzneria kofuensis]MBB5889952.1 AcrR family transcriptional regulator [Kutzneria kofuensis]